MALPSMDATGGASGDVASALALTALWVLLSWKKRELQAKRAGLGLRPGQREEEAGVMKQQERPWRPSWLRVVHVTDAQTVLLSPLVFAWGVVAMGGAAQAQEAWARGRALALERFSHEAITASVGIMIAVLVVPQTVLFTLWDAKPAWAPRFVRRRRWG